MKIRDVIKGIPPGQLVIQYTDRCNARCPQCGMRVTADFPRSKLGLDEAKKIIDAAARHGVESLSFTGGEPLLYLDDIVELLAYADKAGIKYTRTGTNGFMFMGHEKPDFRDKVARFAERIAETSLYTFWISIDSVEPSVHENMRGLPGVIRGIEKAIPVMEHYGIYPSANLGINRNMGGVYGTAGGGTVDPYDYFREGFERFYRFVIDMGFTITNCCYPMSMDKESEHLNAVYQATSAGDIVCFTNAERVSIFRALFDVIPLFRSSIRIFSPRSSLYALIGQYTEGCSSCFPCRGGTEFFFIDARDGNTYPCGYRGHENLGKFWKMDFDAIDHRAHCRRCDWECFRDPSELFGPIADIMTRPLRMVRRAISDREYLRLWLNDLRYYRACHLFNGRRPPDYEKMARQLT
ncbi:MAG: radical SAM protein [Deltaproteobacteria bacterium]|nr:radical SAM protein [Deltaproteobacteria bacterium]MBN2688219.1 radical SAM protein [Deltaproteobacteria bacterium]